MKKFLCLLLTFLIIIILTGCKKETEKNITDTFEAAKERGKFIVGVSYDLKPLGYINENGVPDGFEIDLAKQIAKIILGSENAIEFVQTQGYNSIFLVASKKIDFLIAATTITPQRQLTVAFSDPYYTTGQVILVHQNSDIKKAKDLNYRKVIVQLNSTAEKTPRLYAPAAILVGFKSHQEVYDEFKRGKADAIISDEALLKGFIMENPSEYKILPFKLTSEPYGIVVSNSPESAFLKKAINDALKQLRSDGTINRLKEKWNL